MISASWYGWRVQVDLGADVTSVSRYSVSGIPAASKWVPLASIVPDSPLPVKPTFLGSEVLNSCCA